MTRSQKIEMVAGTSGRTISFVEALVAGDDRLLEKLASDAKERITIGVA